MMVTIELIREYSMRRIAKIFGRNIDEVKDFYEFGRELKSSDYSDFKYGELDVILHDLEDVSDKQARKDIKSGILVIKTVKDYCDFMARCYIEKPYDVEIVLGIRQQPKLWVWILKLLGSRETNGR